MQTQLITWTTQGLKTELVYSSDGWTRVRAALQTAGPVVIGTKQDLGTVAAGQGLLLPAAPAQVEFILSPGDRVYVLSNAVNRINITIEPIPYANQIVALLQQMVDRLNLGVGVYSGGNAPAPQSKISNPWSTASCPPKNR